MTTTNPITISDSAREAEMKATNAAFPVGHFTQLAINSSIEKLNNTINDLLDNGRTLLEQNEKLTAENETLKRALMWFEGYFETNIYGGGKPHCPWCYKSSGDDGKWRTILHIDDCLLGKALNPQLPTNTNQK